MTEEITKQNTLVPDAVAGLTTGIANIADAMASATKRHQEIIHEVVCIQKFMSMLCQIKR
jgi:hypothetical protein